MGASYHQFCPVARAMELLDERWTLLVVRELLAGSDRFNDLRRGVPRMSPSLLSKRLHQLMRAGLVDKRSAAGEVRYVLTPAGRELRPVVEAIGAWGTRWIGEIGDATLDPKLLMWDMHRNVDLDVVPAERIVVRFDFTDVGRGFASWWLVIANREVDVCDVDPGFPVTVTVTTGLRGLTEIWMGERSWREAIQSGELTMDGTSQACRSLPRWFTLSRFADVARPAASAPAS